MRDHHAELNCDPYAASEHATGTKGSSGRCSWTENCAAAPVWSTTATIPTRTQMYAICDHHHARVHQYFTSDAPPEQEVEHLLRCWARGFARTCNANPSHAQDRGRTGDLTVGRRGLQQDECGAFLRTWRSDLVAIGVDGTFTLPGIGACPPELHLIGRSADATALHTEYLIQIGVIAELIEDHGWSPSELAFEQDEFDALGHRHGRVQLAVEAKARAAACDPDGLERLEHSLHRLSANPQEAVPMNHRRKWEALSAFVQVGPVTVLLVASGARRWLRATGSPSGAVVVPSDERSPTALGQEDTNS